MPDPGMAAVGFREGRRARGTMGLFDLPILGALKSRMKWHAERQVVLAQNVANAETPGYGTRDLKAPDFRRMLEQMPARGVASAHAPVPMKRLRE